MRVAVGGGPGGVELCVDDAGPGIPEADLERIFEPFVRGSAAHAPGSGVGLTIARMLTTLMGGEMQVTSTPGAGTVFRIRLFLPQVHSAQAARELPRINRIGYVGVRQRILVVDNEKVDRDMLQSVLEPLGFVIEQAASGYEALQAIPRFAPHLVFMDLGMPGIDGWETIRRIRATDRWLDLPVIALTADAMSGDRERCLAAGMDDYLSKPFTGDALRRLLERWLPPEGEG